MPVTITATKYFTGTGPIKFSEIRNTFGDLPGNDIHLSDYKRNVSDTDWDENTTWTTHTPNTNISPRVPDATENVELPTTNDNIQLSDYRNTIKEYKVVQSGSDEEKVYSDGNEGDWNNNLTKNVNKLYQVDGTIYSNETDKYALTFEEGVYNNLYMHVTGNIYGEGGAAGGGNGGGALYISNTYVSTKGDDKGKVNLNISNNGKIWSGGGGGIDGTDGTDGDTLECTRTKTWNARNVYGNLAMCEHGTKGGNTGNGGYACAYPLFTCKQNPSQTWAAIGAAKNPPTSGEEEDPRVPPNTGNATVDITNKPNGIIDSSVAWNVGNAFAGTRGRCRGGNARSNPHGTTSPEINRNPVPPPDPNATPPYAGGYSVNSAYQCTRTWAISCEGQQAYNKAGGNKGTKGNSGAGKGWSNRNTSINSSPHVGNAPNDGNCNTCTHYSDIRLSCGESGNPGNVGGDWGQAALQGGSAGIAIRKKRVIVTNVNNNAGDPIPTVRGPVNNI